MSSRSWKEGIMRCLALHTLSLECFLDISEEVPNKKLDSPFHSAGFRFGRAISIYMVLKVTKQKVSQEVRDREMKRQKDRALRCHRGQREEE